MELIRFVLRPLARAGRLFFRSQLRLRLRGGLQLEWVEPGATPAQTAESQRLARERSEVSLMVQQLAALLDEDADLRHSLRHLSFVEQALQQQGLQALQEVPLDVLRRALDQFEGLVTNWEPRGLASLRSRMSVAVSHRPEDDDLVVPPMASAAPGAADGRARAAKLHDVTSVPS
jgi:hypothetical protein